MKIAFRYILFILSSTNKHGVHSPFVYNLVTKCFNKKTKKSDKKKFLKIKSNLVSNTNTIKVTDFGSGSKIFKSNERKVSKIAKVAGISTKKAKLLMRFSSYFTPTNCLEIGTSLGLATSAIKIGNASSQITTLEGCKETAKIAEENFKKFNLKNINLIIGDFSKTIEKTIQNKTYDLVYFDGNHTKEATLKYFNTCLKAIHNNSIFIFDDIYWNQEMMEAWSIIKNYNKVTVTIDVFYWGIVFFREEQAKEHFKIRV